jgi:hypothetical protein
MTPIAVASATVKNGKLRWVNQEDDADDRRESDHQRRSPNRLGLQFHRCGRLRFNQSD